ncbi:MAG: hypothetical protein ACRD2X_09740 [Vicinamibacteraceae bacterium]
MHRLPAAVMTTALMMGTVVVLDASVGRVSPSDGGVGPPGPQPAALQEANGLERPFVQGGRITMDLSAGDYTIEGTPDPHIRLSWETRDPRDARDVKVQANVEGNEADVETDGPSDGFRVRIEIPQRSDVKVSLSAGDLTLRGVEGHKDVSAWAGDLKIGIERAADYRRVDASVTAGEIKADPFGGSTGGIFRSFTWDGRGKYDLKARLTAGDLTLGDFDPR